MTASHPRFVPRPNRAPYLVDQAHFVACHQFNLLERLDVLKAARPAGTFLLKSPYGPDEVSGHLPREQAIATIKVSIARSYRKHGEAVVQQNFRAVDQALSHLHEVAVPDAAPECVWQVLGPMIAGEEGKLPVSALPVDGTYPSGTARWEKRSLATEIAVWDPALCIQCC